VQRNVLGTFDAQTPLRFTDGKAPHAYCYDWTSTEQTVLWPARLRTPGEFEVWVKYSTGSAKSGGRFAVEIGNARLEAVVEPTAKDTEPREVKLGSVKVPAGEADVRVRAIKIEGGELMRLFSVTLKP